MMRGLVKTGLVVATAGLLAGCGSSSEPSSTFRVLGNNSYALTTVSSSAEIANAQALQTAQRLCASQGLQSQTQTAHAQFADSVHHFTLEFTCL